MGALRRPLALALLGPALAWSPAGCGDSGGTIDDRFSTAEWAVIQELSPLEEVPEDPTNAYADDPNAAALGQKLFFDRAPAGEIVEPADGQNGGLGDAGEEGKVACADCHMPDDGWFQDLRSNPPNVSLGIRWGERNAPPLVNAAFYEWFTWDGGADSMWAQALGTTESRLSHGSTRLAVADNMDAYRADYEAVFPEPLDPDFGDPDGRFPPDGKPGDEGFDALSDEDKDVVNRVFANYGKALAAYQRQLVSRGAPFDRYVAGDFDAIPESAKRGLKLFIGKAGCVECHNTPLFSDSEFHNTGVPQEGSPYVPPPEEELGRLSAVEEVLGDEFNADGAYSDDRTTDKLDGLEPAEELRGAFRTKHLRQVAETGPYMHTGGFATLREVVEHYDQGGAASGFAGEKDPLMVPLNLSSREKDDLVEFLKTLSGEPIPDSLRQNPLMP